jgi:hypothetical protein
MVTVQIPRIGDIVRIKYREGGFSEDIVSSVTRRSDSEVKINFKDLSSSYSLKADKRTWQCSAACERADEPGASIEIIVRVSGVQYF